MIQRLHRLAERYDGVGEMIRVANSTVTGLAEIIQGIQTATTDLENVSSEFDNTFHAMETSMRDTSENINTRIKALLLLPRRSEIWLIS